jgi:hypothetical protein
LNAVRNRYHVRTYIKEGLLEKAVTHTHITSKAPVTSVKNDAND